MTKGALRLNKRALKPGCGSSTPVKSRLQKSSLTYFSLIGFTKHVPDGLPNKVSERSIAATLPESQGNFRRDLSSRFFELFCRWARIASLKGKLMPTDERITKAVFAAVDGLNEQLPAGVQVEKSLDAPLYGSPGRPEE